MKARSVAMGLSVALLLLLGAAALAAPVKLQPTFQRYTVGTPDSTISLLSVAPLESVQAQIPADQRATYEKAYSEVEAYQVNGGFYLAYVQRYVFRPEVRGQLSTYSFESFLDGVVPGFARSLGLADAQIVTRLATVSDRPGAIVRVTGNLQGTKTTLRVCVFLDDYVLWMVLVAVPNPADAGSEALEKIVDSIRVE